MALSIVTDVTAEPVSIEDQKAHLRIDTDDDDAYIADCIKAARLWIEGQTKRAIMDQTWSYTIDYHWPTVAGAHRIDLPLNPVPQTTSPSTTIITYVDADGASQTLAETQYTLVGRTHGSYIVPAYNITWPTVRHVPNAITVQFKAGASSNVPHDLKRAVMILAGHLYENREPVIIGTSAAPMPYSVETLISPYRRAAF